jgi:HlyD family secretion protein
VIVDLTGPIEKRRALGDGFRVEARIVVSEADAVLIIPASALFRVEARTENAESLNGPKSEDQRKEPAHRRSRSQGDWAVFKVVEGRVIETLVEVSRQNGLEAEITEGLQERDQVVMHPSDQISNGVAVEER